MKFAVLHLGRKDLFQWYPWGTGGEAALVERPRGLGRRRGDMRQQYALAAKKAIDMQGSTSWSTAGRLRKEIYLAPHVEYCIRFGAPQYKKGISKPECSRRPPRYE